MTALFIFGCTLVFLGVFGFLATIGATAYFRENGTLLWTLVFAAVFAVGVFYIQAGVSK